MPHDVNPTCEELSVRFRRMQWRAEARRRAARFDARGHLLPAISQNRILRDRALVCEPIGQRGVELWITYSGMRESALRIRQEHPELQHTIRMLDPDALNGYVAFPKRHAPRLPVNYQGLVQYIPVHGGCTYAVKDSFAAVWGFDTHHLNSEKLPRTNPDWIRYQCLVLYEGLRVAGKLWPKFRREHNDQKRLEMANAVYSIDIAASGSTIDRLGFQALMSLMGGRI
jgi:hypothetical protein